MPDLSKLYDAILDGDDKLSFQLTREALEEAVDPSELIKRWMIPAMDEVGRRFESQEYFIPEIMMAARAMKAALELLRPLLASSGAKPTGRVVLGSVKGDLHDIGKNIVGTMLEGAGFDVVDLGVDVSPDKFIEAAQEKEGSLVALSALLTTTMIGMKTIVEAVKTSGLNIPVVIGGAPVTRDYANEIKAEGYAPDAASAVEEVARLLAP